MAEYCGVVQSMVRVSRNLYSLTFRVHEGGTDGKLEEVGGELDATVYSAEIQLRDSGFTVIPEEKLGECLRLIRDYPDAAPGGADLFRKRVVGEIADEIFGQIRDHRTLQVRSWKEIALPEAGSVTRPAYRSSG